LRYVKWDILLFVKGFVFSLCFKIKAKAIKKQRRKGVVQQFVVTPRQSRVASLFFRVPQASGIAPTTVVYLRQGRGMAPTTFFCVPPTCGKPATVFFPLPQP
jgi:hypothetical protein